jgi:hypothetical protein
VIVVTPPFPVHEEARKMKQTPTKRKTILVERQVQGALGFRIAGHWFMFLAASLAFTITLRLIGNINHGTAWEMVGLALREQAVAIVVMLALLPWFVHDALKLSNRFAGPMVRLRSAIRVLSSGEQVNPLTFRKGDFWGDLAGEFNELQSRVVADRHELDSLKLEVEELKARLANSEAIDYFETAMVRDTGCNP